MIQNNYLYNVNYSEYEAPLCAIEQRALFGNAYEQKVFFTKVKVNPSGSAFIKNRLSINYSTPSFEDLLTYIKESHVFEQDYNVKYIKLEQGDRYAANRNSLCKAIISQSGQTANYETPGVLYGLSHFDNQWYFGVVEKNNKAWKKHDKRPYTYSNSLKINMAKVLINLATKGDLSKSIIDPCCGAGTVLLEGCFAGHTITGADISWKTARNARANLAHFGYEATVHHSAVQDLTGQYDCSVVDLPYGLYSKTSPEAQREIMANAMRISNRVVIVATEDMTRVLDALGLDVVDSCRYIKSVNRKFSRYIHVCEHK